MTWLRAKWGAFKAWAKREANQLRAFLWLVGSGVYQTVQVSGIDAALAWTLKEWASRIAFTFGPALLLGIRAGEKNPTPEEMADAVAKVQADRAKVP
jgi:hypothetical protein